MAHAVEWLEPWYRVHDAGIDSGLEQQLYREISDRHVLFGQSVRLIARRTDTDDALFQLRDGRVAQVHLTWKQGVETYPRWPVTAIYSSLQEWAEQSMAPLHRQLLDD